MYVVIFKAKINQLDAEYFSLAKHLRKKSPYPISLPKI